MYIYIYIYIWSQFKINYASRDLILNDVGDS